jgi:hypothetical protein
MNALNISGWIACSVGSLLWLYGYMFTGTTALIDWPSISPTWISMFMPNLEAEVGLLVMCVGSWPLFLSALRQRWIG